MRNIALDLGARKTTLCEMKNGKVVQRATLRDLSQLEKYVGPNSEPARVAFEACRTGWHLAARLAEWGHEPVMVDTTRVGRLGIGAHGKKNDEIDAEVLVLALEQDRIPRAHILSPHRQEIRMQQTVRRTLVETRSQYIAMTRETARAKGEKIRGSDSERFLSHANEAELSESTRLLVQPWLVLIKELNKQIVVVEQKLSQLCEQESAVQLLCTAPGVSLIVAAAFVSVIDDAKRFRRAHELESYLGLVPRENTTGGRQRLGSISKAGNGYLRALLVQAAWAVLRQQNDDDPLKIWGLSIAEKRGKRIAVVAIARRLAGILWAMWRDASVYEPHILATASTAGLKRAEQTALVRSEGMKRAAKKHQQRKSSWARLSGTLPVANA